MSRGISPDISGPRKKVKVVCPGCDVEIEAHEAKAWVCPECRTAFYVATGKVIKKPWERL